jgi:hypothetical protein
MTPDEGALRRGTELERREPALARPLDGPRQQRVGHPLVGSGQDEPA